MSDKPTPPLGPALSAAIERMARAAVDDSMPRNGMFNEYQLGAMADERMQAYRHIAEVMLRALLEGTTP